MGRRRILGFFLGIIGLSLAAAINQHVVGKRDPEAQAALIARARPLYAARCAGCHGTGMEGLRDPATGKDVTALDSISYRIYFYGMPATTESYVAESSKPHGGMAPAAAGPLTDQERLALAVLIRAVNTGAAHVP